MAMQLPRRKQREILLQLLFSWEVSNGSSFEENVVLLMESLEVSRKNVMGMEERFGDIVARLAEIDGILALASQEYALDRISVVDKNILRIAIFELRFEKDEPRIVIDEALRLSKKFSTPEAVSFVHAVVDEVNKSGEVVLSV